MANTFVARQHKFTSWGFHYFPPWSKINQICRSNALQESAVLSWSVSLSLQMESMAQTLYIMYFVSITTLLFGSLGLFGAIKGKQWALIMVCKPAPVASTTRVNPPQSDPPCPHTCPCLLQSAAGMIIISLFMTACEIPALIFRPQVQQSRRFVFLCQQKSTFMNFN